MKFDNLFLDTETFSACDLKKCGSYAYAEHPSTEIMITTFAIDDGPVMEWDATADPRMPRVLRRALREVCKPNTKSRLVGQNFLLFDRLLMRHCWGIEIPVKNIIDTMICAYRLSLPGSLDALCRVLEISEDLAKDKAGKALIQRFCKPTPKNYKIRRYTRETHPEEWRRFLKYARSDISSMREVFYALPAWGDTEKENEILAIDQAINDRGFYVDTVLAESAIAAVKQHKLDLQREAMAKYGGSLTGKDFLPILRDLAPAFDIPNAQKATLGDLLDDEDLPDAARALIEMRLGAASTASTKYDPLLRGLSSDGRRRGTTQYGGAKRTLRWAGKGFQPQNLARGAYGDWKGDEFDKDGNVIWANYTGELTLGIRGLKRNRISKAFDIAKLCATTVRGCIIAAPGCKLVVADYSNVEGRGLAWISGEEATLKVFRAGTDIYKTLAVTIFKTSYDEVTKDQRQISKACLHRHTQVLTEHGFKDIMEVRSTDKVWSGNEWVRTAGTKLMGWKPVIQVDGVPMTEDHLILSNSWKEAKQLVSNKNILDLAKANGMAAWSSYVSYRARKGTGNCSRNAIAATCRGGSMRTTCAGVKRPNAMPAQWPRRVDTELNISATETQCRTTRTESVCSIDFRQPSPDVIAKTIKDTKPTEAEASKYAKNGVMTAAPFLNTYKRWKAGTTQNWKWTEQTMIKGTSLETFGLLAAVKTWRIDGQLLSFKGCTMLPLPALMNLSGKLTYCEPVYDLINVEGGSQFLIKTASGFLLVHNCTLGLGYGGGVAAFLTFAKNLGLDLDRLAHDLAGTFPDHIWKAARRGWEFARIQEKNKRAPKGKKAERPSYDLPKKVWLTCDALKRMYREANPNIVNFWAELEAAALSAIRNPGRSFWAGARVRENGDKAVKFTRTVKNGNPGWWLKVELPSGRILSYPGIGLSVEKEEDEDTGEIRTRTRIKYQGENQTTRQWGYQYTYGGKLAENIVQALCRDLLAWSMPGVEAAGYKIILSVHDELLTEVPDTPEYTVKELERLMCVLPAWAKDFPLSAEGWEGKRYKK